jgi:hypothetical protein
MKVDPRYLKELGLSDNDTSVLMTPKKERVNLEWSFDNLNKTNEKKIDASIKAQSTSIMKSDKKDKKNKQEKAE